MSYNDYSIERVYHSCGHMSDIGYYGGKFSAERREKTAAARRDGKCRRCQREEREAAQRPVETQTATPIDVTTPAGSTREAALVHAVESGWTDAEIEAGARFRGRETFRCDGCGREFPRSLAMNASLGRSCPDCYDDLSG